MSFRHTSSSNCSRPNTLSRAHHSSALTKAVCAEEVLALDDWLVRCEFEAAEAEVWIPKPYHSSCADEEVGCGRGAEADVEEADKEEARGEGATKERDEEMTGEAEEEEAECLRSQ